MLDDFELDYPEDEDFPDEDEGGSGPNRKLILIAGVLGVGIFIAIGGIAFWFFFLRGPSDVEVSQTQVASSATAAVGGTQTAIAGISAATYTPLPSELPTNTPTATSVPAAALPSATTEGGPTADPRTATVQALLTQAALAQTQAAEAILTVTATPTSTALPDTGFADDVGIPALLGMTGLLILVIFVSRRLREVTA
jgi:LPXTG-motif cell wall-anchored protein